MTGSRSKHVGGTRLAAYVARRLSFAVVVVWAAFTLAFMLLYWLPGDAVLAKFASEDVSQIDPAQEQALRARYGLDGSVFEQYFRRLGKAVQGDFGTSTRTGAPVVRSIVDVLPSTGALVATSLAFGIVVGGGIALLATYSRRRWLREFLLSLPSIGISVPTFWVGLMLIYLVSFKWKLLPAAGGDGWRALILPTITLGLPTAAGISQILAKSMGDALRAPYIEAAKAKGVGRRAIHLRHAVPNASLPVITIIGLIMSNLIAGSAVVETVFSRAGLGRLTIESVAVQDLPVVQGVVVVAAIVMVVVNLLVDLTYPLIDPRISLTSPRKQMEAVGAHA